MKLMKTEDAVGQVLCHDITQIIRGVTKDAVFRKGHVIQEEDVPVLLSVGKDTVYIWENDETMLHENDAAYILRDICMNENMSATEPKEGKIELIADVDGLFLVDLERLRAVNSLGDMMIATRASGFMVKKGDKLCGTRVIPLVIKKERMEAAKQAAGEGPIMRLVPVKPKKYGLVTTGNEVFFGRIEDTFTPVIQAKMKEFGCEMQEHVVLNDDHEKITAAIQNMLAKGCEMVVCTGGMSVDPAGLRDVCEADNFRPGAAISGNGYAGDKGVSRWPRSRRSLPQLQGLPFPELRIWKRSLRDFNPLSTDEEGIKAFKKEDNTSFIHRETKKEEQPQKTHIHFSGHTPLKRSAGQSTVYISVETHVYINLISLKHGKKE